jgi:MraZ protein
MVFPRPEWEAFRARVAQLPMDAHWWRRIFLGNATELDLDSAGRILVSPELRSAAGIQREVILLGMGSHLELWDAATYATKEQAAMMQGVPDALKQFTF